MKDAVALEVVYSYPYYAVYGFNAQGQWVLGEEDLNAGRLLSC